MTRAQVSGAIEAVAGERGPATAPGGSPGLTYQPALDGLRGLAVAAVLLFHGEIGWFQGGFLGVSTFFTLSGFLITSLLLVERRATARIALSRFWSRRARRLLPAAFLALLLAIAYGAFAADRYQVTQLRGDVLAALAYVTNWRFVFANRPYASLFSQPSPVEHFWSLAVEEQFYLVFPLLTAGVLVLGRGSRRVYAAGLAALGGLSLALMFVLYHPGNDTTRVYYGSDTRALELLVGALLAIALTTPRAQRLVADARARVLLTLVGIAGLTGTVTAWHRVDKLDPGLYRGGLGLYALASAAIIAAAVQPGPVRAALRAWPLWALGKISYGVYLYHWPIFLWLDNQRTGLEGKRLFVLQVAVTLAIAIVSYFFVEQPIRKGHRLVGSQPRLALAGAVGIVVVVVASLLVVTANPPAPTVVFAAVGPEGVVPPRAVPVKPGMLAARSDVHRIMIVGDSVGQTLGRGFELWGPPNGLTVWNDARYFCGIVRGGLIALPGAGTTAGCDRWPRAWRADVDAFRPDVVVVLSTQWDVIDRRLPGAHTFTKPGKRTFDAHLIADYETAVDVLSSRGARVVWLTIPCDKRPDMTARYVYVNQSLLPRVQAARPGLRVVDLFDHVCPGGKFTPAVGGVGNARADGSHFSDAGAREVARWLGPKLLRMGVPKG